MRNYGFLSNLLLIVMITASVPALLHGAPSDVTVIKADVCVVGGGSAGIGAAVGASRNGGTVVLVEKNKILGGTSTAGYVCRWEPGPGDALAREIYTQLKRRPNAVGITRRLPTAFGALLEIDPKLSYDDTTQRAGVAAKDLHAVVFEPQIFHQAVRELLEETGRCRVLLETEFTRAEVNGRRVSAIYATGKKGTAYRIEAETFIDASGGAHLCRRIGCETLVGEDGFERFHEPHAPKKPSGTLNAISLCYRVTPRTDAAVETLPLEESAKGWARIATVHTLPAGDFIVNPLGLVPGRMLIDKGYAKTYEIARRRAAAHWRWLKQHAPFKECRFYSFAPMLGIRESHRVLTEYMLTEHDLLCGLDKHLYTDIVAHADHPMDTHGRGGGLRPVTGVYGIPFRCLVPKGWSNVLVAGRCAGFSHLAASSCRLSRTMMALGHAAGRAAVKRARNPVVHADVPDMSMVRVGDAYYMTSTTMHMSPGVPIMKSSDLVNWKIVNHAYDILDDYDALKLTGGKDAYGGGSWASCIRFHKGTYYVSTFARTTGRTYIFTTKDIENGPWTRRSFRPAYHDHTLFFDDDGRVYMIYGGGRLKLLELASDLSGVKPGTKEQVIIEDASAPAGRNVGLPAEGSQLFKVNGRYYLFNIAWPRGGMRTVIVHRADKITGPYEGRVALQDKGVAQGGLIDTPAGKWYAYLFRDYGAVGRIPYLVPVRWEDGWPVLGIDGMVPDTLDLPAGRGLIPGIAASDTFTRRQGDPALPLAWQWNHNPDNELWSVTARKGYLRLTTGRVDNDFLMARNTLTQRTFGPACSGATSIDVANMKNGDFAGLALLQKRYGLVGVRREKGTRSIVMVRTGSRGILEIEQVPLAGKTVHLKAECNFKDRADTAGFFYSLDGKEWKSIGGTLNMRYTLPHFMGYRFALFNYATKTPGGFVDFNYFRVSDEIAQDK